MVTGVETAGLVLGSIPLVVSALEHYAEGISTITKWWRYKRELKTLVRILDAECARFLNTCQKLLQGLVLPDELDELIADPGGGLWKKNELDRKLRVRLDRSYSSYLRSVEDTAAAVKSLEKKLELNSSGAPLWADYHTFKNEYKRIKFSLSRRQYEDIMKRIEKNNDILASLTDQNMELEPLRKRRHLPTQKFKTIQGYAGNLYKLIKRGWTCDCGAPHDANLQLDARLPDDSSAYYNQKPPDFDQIKFKVLFSVNNESQSKSVPWTWQETEIRLLNRRLQGHSNLVGTEPERTPSKPIMAQSPPTEIIPQSKKHETSGVILPVPSRPPKKSVKFVESSESGIDALCVSMYQQEILDPSDLVKIHDICLVLEKCLKNTVYSRNCLGYLCEEGCEPLGIYLPQTSEITRRKHNVRSLGDLLIGDDFKSSNRLVSTLGSHLLSRGDRLGLALTIASSVLQLYKTPWLRENWNKYDILINDTGRASCHEQVYVCGAFPTAAAHQLDQRKTMAHLVRNETLFALGILLIELCLGQAIEAMRTSDDPLDTDQKPNVLTDLYVANRLMDSVYNEGGKRYGDAVRRCIYCEFDQRSTTLDNDEFRQAVYDGVVAPLEDDVKDFYQLR